MNLENYTEIKLAPSSFIKAVPYLHDVIVAGGPESIYNYSIGALQGPLLAGERTISKSAYWAFRYARDILKGPFPLGEKAIAKHMTWAYCYARVVIKGPFPAAEKIIAKDAAWAYHYACNVIESPFPLGEKAIAGDSHYLGLYTEYINKHFQERTQ